MTDWGRYWRVIVWWNALFFTGAVLNIAFPDWKHIIDHFASFSAGIVATRYIFFPEKFL